MAEINQTSEIRVVFIGDEGVGKTSIIHTIVTDTFPKHVDKVFKTVTISPDLYLLPNNVNTVLVDTSASKAAEQQTDSEIEKCNVVVLVYDVNNFENIKRLRTIWLPRIVKINDKVPIIMCGNKMDLRSSSQTDAADLESLLTPNFIEFKQVEMGIECSAKGYLGLIDIISCAQKAVLFPLAPLHDSISKTLKPDFQRALERIFRICDKDLDGFINDDELKDFQSIVFKKGLQRNHITAFKEVLVAECQDFDESQALKGVTLEAFKTFQKILIRKLKMEICWTILRHYGYDNQLQIRQQLWDDHSLSDNELDGARSFELTKVAVDFLCGLYKMEYTQKKVFDQACADRVFMTSGFGCPWQVQRETLFEDKNS